MHTSENEIEDETEEEPPEFGDYSCSKCKFKTYSHQELKHHILRKHTEYTSYPRNCELCEKIFENALQMKKHWKIHSLEGSILGQYACKDCRFLGDNIVTMEVHSGKCSVDDFECGLCDLKFETLENLETHLTSCEVYECEVCEEKFKTLNNIKLHLKTNHDKGNHFFHMKMNRILKERVDCKRYSYSDV